MQRWLPDSDARASLRSDQLCGSVVPIRSIFSAPRALNTSCGGTTVPVLTIGVSQYLRSAMRS